MAPASKARHPEIARIGRAAHRAFQRRDKFREGAYYSSRETIRFAATAIRAVHRHDMAEGRKLVGQAAEAVHTQRELLKKQPGLYNSGFVQDAQKEYAEASCLVAIIAGEAVPTPEQLNVEYAPFLNGIGETVGELRRYILDSLRRDDFSRCEELMEAMDEVYNMLVTIDYPDAITGGLRRTTDMVRGVLERTRGDLTLTLRQRALEQRLADR